MSVMKTADKCSADCSNYEAHMSRCQFCTTTDIFHITSSQLMQK